MTKWSEKEAAVRQLERGGKVDPLELIEAARDPSHPCHDDFTWDVHKAAVERWRDQARAIIRHCKFEVVMEDMTQPVVQYVSSPKEEEDMFVSLPRMRGKTNVSAVLHAELSALSGLSSRVYGIALSKQNIVGVDVVAKLGVVRDSVNELKSRMCE